MSTICGHFVENSKIKSEDIYDMLKKMEHRGPDTHGAYLDGKLVKVNEVDELKGILSNESHIALGHSRLRITGSEKTTQPYTSCDNKLALIHNGEIYNYLKLKTLLLRQHEFKTNSDSEVIVHLLEEAYQGDLLDSMKMRLVSYANNSGMSTYQNDNPCQDQRVCPGICSRSLCATWYTHGVTAHISQRSLRPQREKQEVPPRSLRAPRENLPSSRCGS